MIRKLWLKMLTLWLAGCASAAVWSVGVASAQEVNTQDLLQRLERLEKQNEELRAKLLQPVAIEEAGGAIDTKGVEKIVGDYLKRKDADKKASDAAKGKEFVEVGSDLSMKAFWKDGLRFETPNKDFSFHIRGRAQFDTGWFDPTPMTKLPAYNDGADFRRGRLGADGTCWEIFEWVCEYDFASVTSSAATSNFTDVYAQVTHLPVFGIFRVGRFKEPWSIEELMSDNYNNTMELSIVDQAFAPSRGDGFAIYRHFKNERILFATGIFQTATQSAPINVANGNGSFSVGGGQWTWTSRISGLPIYENDGRCWVHLGASYCHLNYNPNFLLPDFKARGLFRVGSQPQLLDTGSGGPLAASDRVNMWQTEFAGNWGSINWQSEIVAAQVQSNGQKASNNFNPLYWGYYAQASYFLTGEYRPYDKKEGTFSRVKPNENFFLVKGDHEDGSSFVSGKGAWEVVARYAYLDLSSGTYVNPTASATAAAPNSGGTGTMHDLTFGVNWYWNPNMYWLLNYDVAIRQSDTANRNGTVNAVGLRFRWDF